VRWYYIACHCVECNLVGVFADWKCEAGDAAAFLAKVWARALRRDPARRLERPSSVM